MVCTLNTKQLKYAVLLSETLNFSKVAADLGISQPALSKQILHLENELGIKLFERNNSPLSLTPAGIHFIKEAKSMLYKEEQLFRTMEKYKSEEFGKLVIGSSPFRNLYLLPSYIKIIAKKFPGVEIIIHETNSSQLKKDAEDGKCDFAIVNLPVDESIFNITPILKETLVVAVPNDMLHLIKKTDDSLDRAIDFSLCSDLPFIVLGEAQEMRQIFDQLCLTTKQAPKISMEIHGGLISAWAMAKTGIGATILPLQFLENMSQENNLTLFTLKNDVSTRQPVIITKHGQYLSKYAKFSIDLISSQDFSI